MRRLIKFIGTLIKLAVTFVILVVFAAITMNVIVLGSTWSDVVDGDELVGGEYECIFVLGCSVQANGQPSPALKSRLDKAIELYKAGVAPKILMSGDHSGKYYNEVGVMRRYAEANGVPKEDIFLDHYGVSTYDSMNRAKTVFCLESIVVVTEGYHVGRGVFGAKCFGINAKGVQSDKGTKITIKTFAREFVARCKDFVFCLLKVEPQYSSTQIPVMGDGSITHDRSSLS